MEESPSFTSPAPDAGPHLSYGTTATARTSVLAWTGLGMALLGALVAATQVMIVLKESNSPGRFTMVVGLHFFLLPVVGVVLAALGAKHRPKRWPAAAMAIAVLSIATLLLLSSRTWGPPPPGGKSRWHKPTLEWPE
jgi:EamA domain-containing membrane protein RarD